MTTWPIEIDPTYGCWIWLGHSDKRNGQALIWRGNAPFAAYRAVYESLVGEIPPGMFLEHGCNDPRCVRPAHLEPVTKSENEKRKMFRYRCRIKKCKRGHDMEFNAAITPRNGRVCRTCSRSEEP